MSKKYQRRQFRRPVVGFDCECPRRCPSCRNKCLGAHTYDPERHLCAEFHHWETLHDQAA